MHSANPVSEFSKNCFLINVFLLLGFSELKLLGLVLVNTEAYVYSVLSDMS